MNTIKRFSTLCLLTYLLANTPSLSAQYISGVTLPDTSQSISQDLNDFAVILSNTITSEDLHKHLSILASDEFEGRETGEKGNELAAEYIANHFKSLGLPAIGLENSYYQKVAFNRTYWKKNSLQVNQSEYKHLWDYLTFASLNENMPLLNTKEITFLGYGIDDKNYSDYKGNNLKDKIIMINAGEPINKDSISYITGTKETSEWSQDIYKKLKVAKENGVKFVFVIQNEIQKFLGENRKYLVSPSLQLGDGQYRSDFASHAYISSGIAQEIIGKKAKKIKRWRKKNKKKGKARDIKLNSDLSFILNKNIEVIAGENVLGYVEGTDLKDELIVVSAHYDHLGTRGKDIFNGADDNGSGTSTVLELAEAFVNSKAMGQGPRRSVLFLLVTGEEKGLLGSEYYAENPLFPIENTIANINIDMVGRVDKKYTDNPNYIYVIGSDRLSSELHTINEQMNQKYSQLILDYKYNDEKDPNRYYFRSDHYNFAKKGIPAIFFFNGTHKDYHRPSDTVEKINFTKMEKVARHIFHTTWHLANRNKRIIVDGKIEQD